jgi:transglutaminase-like putative cysteine protease
MRSIRFMAALLALVPSVLAQKPEAKRVNLLKNGDFESGGTHDAASWANIWPRGLYKKAPRFDRVKEGVHGGAASGLVSTDQTGGFSSFTQEVVPPKGAKTIRLTGWLRYEPDADEKGMARLMIAFSGVSDPQDAVRYASHDAAAKGWTKASLIVGVPPESTKWLVRCGLSGAGTGFFDDVELYASEAAAETVSLFIAHSDYSLTETTSVSEPWIDLPIPFPFEGQTPLAARVLTTPPGRTLRTQTIQEGENSHVRVWLKPAGPGKKTDVRLQTLVMVRDRNRGPAKGVPMAKRAALPSDVAAYFKPTPGIDADDPEIKAVAAGFKNGTLSDVVGDVLAWLRAEFKYEGGGDQGGKASFQRRNAVCTGHANLAASLFQAADAPCRVLGCLVGSRLQEHYIVEVWAPVEGWRRVESTSKVFPIRDSMHLILHVAHPGFPRGAANVPLLLAASDGCRAGFGTGDDGCFQGSIASDSLALEPDGAGAEKAARGAFERWANEARPSGEVRLLKRDDPGAPAKGPLAELHAAVDAFLK